MSIEQDDPLKTAFSKAKFGGKGQAASPGSTTRGERLFYVAIAVAALFFCLNAIDGWVSKISYASEPKTPDHWSVIRELDNSFIAVNAKSGEICYIFKNDYSKSECYSRRFY